MQSPGIYYQKYTYNIFQSKFGKSYKILNETNIFELLLESTKPNQYLEKISIETVALINEHIYIYILGFKEIIPKPKC